MICDLAETYHIFDYRKVPVSLLATLVNGLRDESRIAMAMGDRKIPNNTLLLAQGVDALNLIVWSKTEDGQAGRNKPKSIVQFLLNGDESETVAFSSVEEYEEARARIIRGE